MATPEAAAAEPTDRPMPLVEHLRELRTRLMISVIAVAVGFGACYWRAEYLFDLLLAPLREVLPDQAGNLIFTGLTEPFLVYIKTGLLGGVLLAMPVLFLQLWLFVKPAFRGDEGKYASAFVVLGSLLFLVGAGFGYFVVFPFGFQFLIQIAGEEFLPYLTIKEYFSLATKMLFAFGVMFETPLVLVFLGRLGLVDAAFLRKHRRFAIVLLLVTAAILTPPDVLTQLMLAGPLYLLYESGVLLVAIFGKPRTDPELDPEGADEAAADEEER